MIPATNRLTPETTDTEVATIPAREKVLCVAEGIGSVAVGVAVPPVEPGPCVGVEVGALVATVGAGVVGAGVVGALVGIGS